MSAEQFERWADADAEAFEYGEKMFKEGKPRPVESDCQHPDMVAGWDKAHKATLPSTRDYKAGFEMAVAGKPLPLMATHATRKGWKQATELMAEMP